MGLFDITLILAILLCSLVAGFLFGFAVVAMPGIGTLKDGEFIRAFQVMDRIIQNNHPLFILVWVGSAVSLLAAAVLGFRPLEGLERLILLAAALIYFLGVQLPTVLINIPLNNQLQRVNVDAVDAAEQQAARAAFEPRWNQWNVIRTILAILVSLLLILLLGLL